MIPRMTQYRCPEQDAEQARGQRRRERLRSNMPRPRESRRSGRKSGHIEPIGGHREKRPDEQVDVEAAEFLPVDQFLEL